MTSVAYLKHHNRRSLEN